MRAKTNRILLLGTLALIAGVLSCKDSNFAGPASKNSNSESNANHKETFRGAQREPYQTDIIYLLDTSDSMKDKIKRVLDNLNSQTNDFLNKAKDLDYQIIVVGDAEVVVANAKLGHIQQFIGSHGALSAAMNVIAAGTKTQNGLAVRQTSVKELVVVSDDDADVTADEFLTWMDQNNDKAREVHVNAIVKLNKISCGVISSVSSDAGKQYISLANNERTKGFIGDICKGDWTDIFQNLGSQLSQFRVSPRVTVQLKGRPIDYASIAVKVNGAVIDKTKFQYDIQNNKIIIQAETTEKDQVEVAYN